MADEQQVIPEAEAVQPPSQPEAEPIEAEEQPQAVVDEVPEGDEAEDAELELEGDGTPEGEGEVEEAAATMAEIEFGGKKYEVPEELKKGFMLEADYTRKSQANAADRKFLEQQATLIDASRRATGEETQIAAELTNIDQQLEQANSIDWQTWWDAEPIEAGKAQSQINALTARKSQLNNALTEVKARQTETAQQETALRLKETQDYAAREIKGWTPEVHTQIRDFAVKDMGFDEQQLIAAYNPKIYKTLHLAWLGSQTLKKQQVAKPKSAAPKAKPLSKITGKSGPTARKTMGEMSMDEYAAYRDQQEARKRKAGNR